MKMLLFFVMVFPWAHAQSDQVFQDPVGGYAGETYYLAPYSNTAQGYCTLEGFYSVVTATTTPLDSQNAPKLLRLDSYGNFASLSGTYTSRLSSITCGF